MWCGRNKWYVPRTVKNLSTCEEEEREAERQVCRTVCVRVAGVKEVVR